MSNLLTAKQRGILDWIVTQVKEHQYCPTIKEIGRQFDLGTNRGVTVHIEALERKGYLEKHPGQRGWKILSTSAGKRLEFVEVEEASR